MYADVIKVLEPMIGRSMAVMCLRSAAVSIGRPAENLERADFDRLEVHIRNSLSGITTTDVLDAAVSDIKGAIG